LFFRSQLSPGNAFIGCVQNGGSEYKHHGHPQAQHSSPCIQHRLPPCRHRGG
jgi:hypothetical protein